MAYLIAGVYLLALSAAAYYVQSLGGNWGRALPLALLLATIVALVLLFSSRSARHNLRLAREKYALSVDRGCLVATALMWTLPFLIPSYWFFSRTSVAEPIAAGLGLAAMSLLPASAARLALPRIALLPLAFAGLILVQAFLGRVAYQQEGLLAVLYLLWASGLVILGGTLRREFGLDRVVAVLAWFALAGALASAVIGWAQHIGISGLPTYLMHPPARDRVWANLGQPNQLATYLTLGLASAGYLCATGRLRLILTAPVILALGYVLGLTASRSVWFYLSGVTVLSLVFWGLDRSVGSRRLLGFSVAALAAFALLPLLLDLLLSTQASTAGTSLERLSPGILASDPRLQIWLSALLMSVKHPMLGVGLGEFSWHHFVLNAQLPAPRVTGFIENAHNLPLHVLAEFGLIGFSLLSAFVLLFFAGLVRQPRTPAHWWVWAILGVLAAHSMVEYPLWYAFFLGVAAVVVGLGESRAIGGKVERSPRSGQVILVVLLGLGWYALVQLLWDAMVLRDLYRDVATTPEFNRQVKDRLGASPVWPNAEFALSHAMSINAVEIHESLALNGRVMHRYPVGEVVYRQAVLLALSGDQEGARRQFDLAAASFPAERSTLVVALSRRVDEGARELEPLLAYARGSDDSSR